jgi:hypothetical protein
MEDGKLVHYLDAEQLALNPSGLGLLAGEGFRFLADGKSLDVTVRRVRVYRVGTQPDFATLEEAKAAFVAGRDFFEKANPLYVGDAVVDIVLFYKAGGPVHKFAVSSTLDPGLPGQENTANLILDYGSGETRVFRARGLLDKPVTVSGSSFSAVVTFIKEGIRHILEGLDHVLFVFCLVLGALQLKSLAWRVTGFTIGHSITLTVGFFGFVPSGAWFVPAVEAGISLSIIYVAAIVLMSRGALAASERNTFVLTLAIGLLHGLGFSFVLHKILQIDAPDIWQSLLAFNIGVEIGQLSIVLVAWPAIRFAQRSSGLAWRVGRVGIAMVCIAVATVWTGQRVLSIIAVL